MVKSYQGVPQAKPDKAEPQLISVRDFMATRLITFHPEQTMDQVTKILLEKKISGGPVVDDDNQLVGVISEGDCLKEVVRGKYNNMLDICGKVSEYMAKEVKTIHPEMNILEAAKMFLHLKVRRFPVIKDGKLVGQISQKDIMQAVHKLKQASWK